MSSCSVHVTRGLRVRSSRGVRLGLVGLAFSLAGMAQAEPVQWSSGHVDVSFDPEAFQFSKDDHSFGGVTQVDVSPLLVSYSPSGNGVVLDFQDMMSLDATSYTTFSPETLAGNFNAYFSITPHAGYAITGYTVTLAGNYSIETPGTVDVGSTVGAGFSQTTGSGAFSVSKSIGGAMAPALQGSLSVTGDVTTIQVLDGYEQVFDHNETVLDYCDTEAPFTCYYREEPVFVAVPYYHDETDLGEASLNLRTITLQAQVVAVPEPEAFALLLAGVPLVGCWAARRRAAAAAR